jgi:hypothetical protein
VPDPREPLGQLVREVWVACAEEAGDTKPSHLAGWEDLDAWNREVDMRIGVAVAAYCSGDRSEWLCGRCRVIHPYQPGQRLTAPCPVCGTAMAPTSPNIREIERLRGLLAKLGDRAAAQAIMGTVSTFATD